MSELRRDYPHVCERTRASLAIMDEEKINLDLIEDLLRHIVDTSEDGAVLVFMPGLMEVRPPSLFHLPCRCFTSPFTAPSSFPSIPSPPPDLYHPSALSLTLRAFSLSPSRPNSSCPLQILPCRPSPLTSPQITHLYERLVGDVETFGNPDKCVVYPLHSALSTSDQRAIFVRPPPGVRKIVISTNVRRSIVSLYLSHSDFLSLLSSPRSRRHPLPSMTWYVPFIFCVLRVVPVNHSIVLESLAAWLVSVPVVTRLTFVFVSVSCKFNHCSSKA